MIDTPAIEKLLSDLNDAGVMLHLHSLDAAPCAAAITTIRALMEAVEEQKAERALLQDILDSRPAINAGLHESYARWSQAIYSGEIFRASLSSNPVDDNIPAHPAANPNGWQPIETAPKGNENDGPFFDVTWEGDLGRYGHARRVINCYREGDIVKVKHGYPAVWTIFQPQPTHWRPQPPAIRSKGDA